MECYSTRDRSHRVGLREAVLRGLPPDNGLYMPVRIPELPAAFWSAVPSMDFPTLSFQMARALLAGGVPERDLQEIVASAINFPAPLVRLQPKLSILELFHGPSLAFKDFGARFMARLMGFFNRGEERELTILVATSGDTGGAVAAGFYQTPGIRVVILYPKGKVSPLQEQQLTTWGGNIEALEIAGNFDDCQALVKKAFLDPELGRKLRLSSANSINIARLIPQSFYYVEAWKQRGQQDGRFAFVVPSGNFGNLTAGLIAQRMGLPVQHFVAATNLNRVVPDYLDSGQFSPRASTPTLSNAMDVGNPSNFVRMLDLYGSTWNRMRRDLRGYAFTDAETLQKIRQVYEGENYLPDPHTAVGLLAAESYLKEQTGREAIVLATAHPAKFVPAIKKAIGKEPDIPPALARLRDRPSRATPLPVDFEALRSYLLD